MVVHVGRMVKFTILTHYPENIGGRLNVVLDNSVEAWNERARQAQTPWEAASFSEYSQVARYDTVAKYLKIGDWPGNSVLDWGCGFGRFVDWVSPEFTYCGYDHSPEMVARAKELYPKCKFASDVKELELGYDHIVAIGVWTLASAFTYLNELTWLWDRARKSLIACLYRGTDERCTKSDPIAVVALANSLTNKWLIDATYLPNDFLVAMYK